MPRQATGQSYSSWLVRSFGLPKPLFGNIVLFLPLSRTWATQLRNLTHHLVIDATHVVLKGMHIINEVLSDAKSEYPALLFMVTLL
jgi:hypothetical protein